MFGPIFNLPQWPIKDHHQTLRRVISAYAPLSTVRHDEKLHQ